MLNLINSAQSLASGIGTVSSRSALSIKKIVSSVDPVQRARNGNDSGGISLASNLSNQSYLKSGSVRAFQNAMTIMQTQSEGLRQAEKIYDRMLTLASFAADPMTNDSDRMVLAQEFESLRQESLALGKSSFNGVGLFDEAAASTQYDITFGSQLSDQSGVKSETKDVLYNTGSIEIDLNGGTAGEAYSLWQGGNKIFDTGANWKTEGSARTYDYDRFTVEFGPNKQNTFQFEPMSPGINSNVFLDDPPGYPDNLVDNGEFDNKKYYLKQLLNSTTDENGLTPSDPNYKTTSGWESRIGQKYTSLGQVGAFDVNSDSTSLELRVDTSSWFQVKGRFIAPEAESSVVGSENDLGVRMDSVGLGLLRENDDAAGFPVLSIATLEDAQKALVAMTGEIEGLATQFSKIVNNMNRVEISLDATQKQISATQKALGGIHGDGFENDLIALGKSRIARSQSASLMTQAINLNQDIVHMLI